MHLALNMATFAKEEFSRGAMVETQYLIRKPHAKVREQKKLGVEFPGHKKVKAVKGRHMAMLHQHYTAGRLPHQNGTV